MDAVLLPLLKSFAQTCINMLAMEVDFGILTDGNLWYFFRREEGADGRKFAASPVVAAGSLSLAERRSDLVKGFLRTVGFEERVGVPSGGQGPTQPIAGHEDLELPRTKLVSWR